MASGDGIGRLQARVRACLGTSEMEWNLVHFMIGPLYSISFHSFPNEPSSDVRGGWQRWVGVPLPGQPMWLK